MGLGTGLRWGWDEAGDELSVVGLGSGLELWLRMGCCVTGDGDGAVDVNVV